MPSTNQTTKSTIHRTRTITVYGNMSEMIVPIPAFLSYRCATSTMKGKYTNNGVITLTGESPIRQATNTVCGVTPSCTNSDTKTGAKTAHFGNEPDADTGEGCHQPGDRVPLQT